MTNPNPFTAFISRERLLTKAGADLAMAVAHVLNDVEWQPDSPTKKLLKNKFAAWVRAVNS